MSASDQEDLEHGLFSGIPVPWESVLGLIKVWFSHVFLVSACESREDSKLSFSSLVYWWRLHPSCQTRTGLPSLSYPSIPSQTCLHLPRMFVEAAISFEDANPNKTVLTLRPSVSVQDETISKELAAALKQLESRNLFRSSLLGLLPLGPIDEKLGRIQLVRHPRTMWSEQNNIVSHTRWCPPSYKWVIIPLTSSIDHLSTIVIGLTNQLS